MMRFRALPERVFNQGIQSAHFCYANYMTALRTDSSASEVKDHLAISEPGTNRQEKYSTLGYNKTIQVVHMQASACARTCQQT